MCKVTKCSECSRLASPGKDPSYEPEDINQDTMLCWTCDEDREAHERDMAADAEYAEDY